MRFSENRLIAWIVLAVCVVGSIVGLGGSSMARERSQLLEVFYEGTDTKSTTRHSMDAYLDRALDCAQIMANEVQLHLGDSDAVQKTFDAIAHFDDDETLDTRFSAFQTLQQTSDQLYNLVYGSSMTDAQRVNFKTAYDDFWGAEKYIRTDPYRKLASEFNAALDSFPASLVCGVLGVDELNSFGNG